MKSIACILFNCLFFIGFSQPTGNLEDSILFNGVSRPYSIHVPLTYNSNINYKIVVGLHGCVGGSTPGKAFRDQLQFLGDSIQAIVVCPNGQPSFANGQMNEPDDQMILQLIDTILNTYSADPGQVFLTGFSCNGYITAKFGLKEIYPFRGVIPFNGWITNSHFSNNDFDFDNNTNTCICYGENDPNLLSGQLMHSELLFANNSVYLNEIPGVAHTTNFKEFPNEMMECFNWIAEQPNSIQKINLDKVSILITVQQIKIIPSSNKAFDFSILSLSGQNIKTSSLEKEATIDISQLPKGIYIWSSNQLQQSGKFIR